jgi:hypothetical protein
MRVKKKKIVRDYEEKMSYDDKVSTKVSGQSYDFWLVFWLVLGLEYWLVFWLVLGLVGLTLASSMESPWALMLVFWLVFWLVLGLVFWLVLASGRSRQYPRNHQYRSSPRRE